jgi:hypothetical protein
MIKLIALFGLFGVYYLLYHTKFGRKIIDFIVEAGNSF